MYVCMYECFWNTAKTLHDSAKILGPPYSPFSCDVQYQVSFKSGNEKIINKWCQAQQIPPIYGIKLFWGSNLNLIHP